MSYPTNDPDELRRIAAGLRDDAAVYDDDAAHAAAQAADPHTSAAARVSLRRTCAAHRDRAERTRRTADRVEGEAADAELHAAGEAIAERGRAVGAILADAKAVERAAGRAHSMAFRLRHPTYPERRDPFRAEGFEADAARLRKLAERLRRDAAAVPPV